MVTPFAPLRSGELAARRGRSTLVLNSFTTRYVSSGRPQTSHVPQQQTSLRLRLRRALLPHVPSADGRRKEAAA